MPPLTAAEARLLSELPLRRHERLLALVHRSRRKLQELFARRLAQLANENDVVFRIDGHDRNRAWMFDDLALVIAPPLERDVDELPVVDGARRIRLHTASLSTSARSSGPNHGCEPAAAFARACAGSRVAGIATSTRSSDRPHLRSACGHVSTPNSRNGASSAGEGGRLSSEPSPNGRITITARPSSSASGSSTRLQSRSSGLYGSCTVSKRRVRIASASSSKAPAE